MGKDEKTAAAAEANETGENQSKKAAKKLAKEAAKAAKVIIYELFFTKQFLTIFFSKQRQKLHLTLLNCDNLLK